MTMESVSEFYDETNHRVSKVFKDDTGKFCVEFSHKRFFATLQEAEDNAEDWALGK